MADLSNWDQEDKWWEQELQLAAVCLGPQL